MISGDRELVGADIARPPLGPPDAALIGCGTAAVSGGNRVDRRAARPDRHRGGGASVVLQRAELGVTAATGAGLVAVAQVAAAVRDRGAGAPGAVRAEARGDDRVLQLHVVGAQRGLDEQASAHACGAGGACGGPGSAAGPDPVAGHGRIPHPTGSRRDRDPTAVAAGAARTREPATGAAGARDVAVQGAVDHRQQPGSTEDAAPRGAHAAAAVGTERSRAGTSQAPDPPGAGAVAGDRRGCHRQRALILEPAAAPARSSAAARAGHSERVGVPAASPAARTGAVARNSGVDQRQPALVVHATATAPEAAVSAVAAGASATPARSPSPRRVPSDRDRIEDQRPTVEDAPAVAGGSSVEAIGSGTARGAADARDAARPRRSGWCTPAGDAQAAQHEPRAARHRQHSVAEPARIDHRGPQAGAGDRERRGAVHVQVAAGVVIRPRGGDRQHVPTRSRARSCSNLGWRARSRSASPATRPPRSPPAASTSRRARRARP